MISATPGRTQASAILSNQRNKKSLIYAAFAITSNAQIRPTEHSKRDEVSGSSPLVGSLYSA
jgi:hypothetical protein